jgi:hypothetical protein
MSALPPLAQEDHVCASCGLAYADVSVEEIPQRMRAVTVQIGESITDLGSAELTHRPDDQTWSALEYLCHVRDVYIASTIRLYRTRKESDPPIEPVFNDLRVLRFRYNAADVHGVLHEMAATLEGLLDEMARTTDWERTFSRQPGERRTARWLARQAYHEALHHLADMRSSAGSA